jgi:sigma-B regulation protein RsbU (phosphoserine phosphatase)
MVDKTRVEAKIEELRALTAFVSERATAHGMSKEELSRVELVVEEIFTNQVRYAYKGEGGDVEVACGEGDGGTFCVRFIDWGPPFDPCEQPPPDTSIPLEDRKPGGLGLHLARKMSSGFDYHREDDRNVLTVCFGRRNG